MPKRSEANRKTNIGVARSIPVLLLGAIGYASWVVTKLVCIDYLLNPPASIQRRRQRGSAVAILITYYLLLIAALVSYGRLLETVIRKPGLIPRGPSGETNTRKRSRRRPQGPRHGISSKDEKASDVDPEDAKMPNKTWPMTDERLPFRVEDFWKRDVFVCEPDGRPRFCSTCRNWKPDRSHHCSELNRCVLKFDHFCPWVGGPVSETSCKFFIQFTFYGALYTLEVLLVMAYFIAQRKQETNFLNGHWIAVVTLGGLFFLFSAGMCMSSSQFALINSTTVENLNRKTKVWTLAVYVSPAVLNEAREKNIQLRLISYPRPPEEQQQMLEEHDVPNAPRHAARMNSAPTGTAEHRIFAILETEPGANPFNLGPLANFQEIMGLTVWEWLSPLHPSPCLKHDDPYSLYKLGPVLDELKANTGLQTWARVASKERRRRRRRRSTSRQSTTHNDRQA